MSISVLPDFAILEVLRVKQIKVNLVEVVGVPDVEESLGLGVELHLSHAELSLSLERLLVCSGKKTEHRLRRFESLDVRRLFQLRSVKEQKKLKSRFYI